MMSLPENKPQRRSPMLTIFLTVLLDLVGVGIIIPILAPLLFNSNELVPASVPYATRVLWQGTLMGIFSLAQFVSAPLLGSLSDKHGRRPVLFYSLFAAVAGYALFAVAIHLKILPLMVVGRALSGIAGGNLSVVYSAIADVSDARTKTKNFGLVGAAFGLGFLVGPFIGGFLTDASLVHWFEFSTPYWFAASLSLLNLVLVYVNFPETNRHPNPQARVHPFTGLQNLKKGFSNPQLRQILTVVLLFSLGFNVFVQFFQTYLVQKFHFNEQQIGYYFGVVGVWSIITQVGVLRLVAGRISPVRLLTFCLLGASLAFLAMLTARTPLQLYLMVPLLSLTSGLTNPNFSAMVSNSAPPQLQGETLGIQQSVQTACQVLASAFGIYVVGIRPEFTLIFASLFTGLSWLVFVLTRKKLQPQPPAAVQSQP